MTHHPRALFSRLRATLLIEAVERVDDTGEILSHEERRAADAHLEGEGFASPRAALERRALDLTARLAERSPALAEAAHALTTRPSWLPLALTLLPLSAGWLTHAFSAGGSFHVLSPTFVALIAWNAVSVTLIALSARGGGADQPHTDRADELTDLGASPDDPLDRLARRARGARGLRSAHALALWALTRLGLSDGRRGEREREALGAFSRRWLEEARPVLLARTRQALHLSALCFALGALLGAYWDGLVQAYEATRSSTFISAPQMQTLLSILLWPSTLLMGPISLQSEGDAMREGLAAAWVHRYAITLTAFVLAPRALLWWAEGRLAARAAGQLGAARLEEPTPTLNVALAAHTNEGKTSLARTLLRRDVGEVRDAEHVTQERAGYFLANTSEGRVRLWDTPGFGDARALNEALERPDAWGWLRAQAPTDQRRYDYEAARALKEEADLILYVVPAAPSARQTEQVRDEWRLLRRVGVPVIAVVNKLNASDLTITARERLSSEAVGQWREALKGEPHCRAVISLDAFSRSLRDELVLFQELEAAAPLRLKPIAAAARVAKERAQLDLVSALSVLICDHLIALGGDEEPLPAQGGAQGDGLRRWLKSKISAGGAEAQAREELSELLWARTVARRQQSAGAVCDVFGLDGELRQDLEVLRERLITEKTRDLDQHKRLGLWGGLISGLASGIAADLMAGGLTLGGGMIVGGLAGLIAGIGAAEVRHHLSESGGVLRWDDAFVLQEVASLLSLCALCARFGRARGALNIKGEDLQRVDGELAQLIQGLKRQEGALSEALKLTRQGLTDEARGTAEETLRALLKSALGLQEQGAEAQ